jgi:hypothetical protein
LHIFDIFYFSELSEPIQIELLSLIGIYKFMSKSQN